jgi:hypothetical protein
VRDALQTYAPAPRPGRRHAARAYALFALLVAAYLAATIFQGVNWTDEGYHYALGQLLFSNLHGPGGAQAQFPLVHWLSIALSGWWLRLIPGGGHPDGGILWARLGWVLAWTCTATLALALARRTGARGPLAPLLAFAALTMATFHNPACLEYNLLTACIVCALGALYADLQARPGGGLWRYLAAGAVLAACVPAKVTAAPLVVVFPVFLVLARCPRSGVLATLAALVLGSLLLFAIPAHYGVLGDYWATVTGFLARKGPGEHHGLGRLAAIYAETLLSAAGWGAALLATSGAAALAVAHLLRGGDEQRDRDRRWAAAVLLCAAVVVAHVVLLKNLSFAIVGASGALLLLALARSRREEPRIFRLLLLLLLLAGGAVAGSNFPAHGIKYMLPALLPVACLFLLRSGRDGEEDGPPAPLHALQTQALRGNRAQSPRGNRAQSLRARLDGMLRIQIPALAVGLLLVAVAFRITNPYLDLRQRWRLTAPMAVPAARLVTTAPYKAQAIDDLYAAATRLLAPREPMICAPDLPLAHFLLDHPPALGSAWIEALPPDRLNARLAALGAPPPPVLIASFDPQTREWAPKDFARAEFAATYELLFAFLREHGYRTAWKSDFFTLYLPPDR